MFNLRFLCVWWIGEAIIAKFKFLMKVCAHEKCLTSCVCVNLRDVICKLSANLNVEFTTNCFLPIQFVQIWKILRKFTLIFKNGFINSESLTRQNVHVTHFVYIYTLVCTCSDLTHHCKIPKCTLGSIFGVGITTDRK